MTDFDPPSGRITLSKTGGTPPSNARWTLASMEGDAARPEAATAQLEVFHTAVQTSLTPAHRVIVLLKRLVFQSQILSIC